MKNIDWQLWLIKISKYALLVLAIFSLGVYGGYRYFVPELKTALAEAQLQLAALHQTLDNDQKQPPKIATETKTKTEIIYLPKETIIYKDAVTGEMITGLETTDVQLNVKPPTINMKYNGKSYEMPGISGETEKFEKGKLVGEVSTAATIDVTDLVNKETARRMAEQEKNLSIGGYLTNEGLALSLGIVNKDLEYKIIGTVPDFKKFYGAGVEFKF